MGPDEFGRKAREMMVVQRLSGSMVMPHRLTKTLSDVCSSRKRDAVDC